MAGAIQEVATRALCCSYTWYHVIKGVGEFGLVGFRFSVSYIYIKSIPTHEKLFAVGKKVAQWLKCHFLSRFFLGLSWPWVGEVGRRFHNVCVIYFLYLYTIIWYGTCFPTQHNFDKSQIPFCT